MKYLLMISVLIFSSISMAVSFETELQKKKKTSEKEIAQTVKLIAAKSLHPCSKAEPRTECFLKVIRERTLTAPYEYLSFANEVPGLIKKDVNEGKTTKSGALLTLSDCLLTLLEHVNLSEGWINTYKPSSSDSMKVSVWRAAYKDIMEKAKHQGTETVANNLVKWGQLNVNGEIPPDAREHELKNLKPLLQRKDALEKMHFN